MELVPKAEFSVVKQTRLAVDSPTHQRRLRLNSIRKSIARLTDC